MLNRKEFIKTSSAALAVLASGCSSDGSFENIAKSIRLEMIQTKASIESKLNLAKEAGFDAVEVNSLGYERMEMQEALEKTRMKVVSVYHSDNWVNSLSSLDESQRSKAVSSVLTSIQTAELYDAQFIQLLPGREVEFGVDGKKSLLKSLQQIVALLNGKVKILLQNFSGRNMDSPRFVDSIFKNVNSPHLGFCLDTELASKNGKLQNWSLLLNKYFSKIDIDESNFVCLKSLLVDTQNIKCLSLDFAGGTENRISQLGNKPCYN